MTCAKSQAQLQREYRERQKNKDPELLRARDHEKYRRRCLRKQILTTIQNVGQRNNHKNLSVEGINHDDSVRSLCVDEPHHARTSSVDVEMEQREIHAYHDNRRGMDKSSARKLYLIDGNAYRNSTQREASAETTKERPVAECGSLSRLENAELEHKIKCVLFKLLNSGITTMNIGSSHATNDHRHTTSFPKHDRVKINTNAKPGQKTLRKKVAEKKITRNTERKHI